MSRDKATKFDGISRPSNDLYKKNFDLIFKNKKIKKTNKKTEVKNDNKKQSNS
jgi:transposase-like protein